jgi:hypothetical protein
VTLSIVTPERVRVPAPWYIIHATDDVCTTVGASCVNVTTAGSAYALVLVTDDPSALPRNLFIDFGPCP